MLIEFGKWWEMIFLVHFQEFFERLDRLKERFRILRQLRCSFFNGIFVG